MKLTVCLHRSDKVEDDYVPKVDELVRVVLPCGHSVFKIGDGVTKVSKLPQLPSRVSEVLRQYE